MQDTENITDVKIYSNDEIIEIITADAELLADAKKMEALNYIELFHSFSLKTKTDQIYLKKTIAENKGMDYENIRKNFSYIKSLTAKKVDFNQLDITSMSQLKMLITPINKGLKAVNETGAIKDVPQKAKEPKNEVVKIEAVNDNEIVQKLAKVPAIIEAFKYLNDNPEFKVNHIIDALKVLTEQKNAKK